MTPNSITIKLIQTLMRDRHSFLSRVWVYSHLPIGSCRVQCAEKLVVGPGGHQFLAGETGQSLRQCSGHSSQCKNVVSCLSCGLRLLCWPMGYTMAVSLLGLASSSTAVLLPPLQQTGTSHRLPLWVCFPSLRLDKVSIASLSINSKSCVVFQQ